MEKEVINRAWTFKQREFYKLLPTLKTPDTSNMLNRAKTNSSKSESKCSFNPTSSISSRRRRAVKEEQSRGVLASTPGAEHLLATSGRHLPGASWKRHQFGTTGSLGCPGPTESAGPRELYRRVPKPAFHWKQGREGRVSAHPPSAQPDWERGLQVSPGWV